jgi:2-polyprenyl-3-methyl-5-hydroxy-6-metoxy-1,4-benzoquinol methylase
MQSFDDAFGHGLFDYSIRENVHEVIERDDGFISVSNGPGIYFAEFDDWQPAEQEAMNFAYGRVLDIGCGAGRHALYLQDIGLDVVGIDVSPVALKVSQQRGLLRTRQCSITEINSKFVNFDTILMLGNNFGLMANPRRAKWLLRRF